MADLDLPSNKVGEERKKRNSPKKGTAGRLGFDDFPSAPVDIIENQHTVGDICPCCATGKLYSGLDRQGFQYDGEPPIKVKRHIKKVLRCNACGKEQIPAASIPRQTNAANTIVTLQRIFGLPLYRQAKLQTLYGVPLAETTMYQMGYGLWDSVGSLTFNALCQFAQAGAIFGGDDTRSRILEVKKEVKEGLNTKKGCYTSSLITEVEDHKVVLYFTGNKHFSDNFEAWYMSGSEERLIYLMVDASSNNNIAADNLKVIFAYCLAHGRRKFVDALTGSNRALCERFLLKIAEVYKNDNFCQEKALSSIERRDHHKTYSLPIMESMFQEMEQLFADKKVEPNSDMGKIFKYFLKRKDGFIVFTQTPGIPLDNNATERSLRPHAISRKNSLFYKTRESARVWSELSSLVYTCEQNGVNPYDYLNWLQENSRAVQISPEKHLPWHFLKETERIAA